MKAYLLPVTGSKPIDIPLEEYRRIRRVYAHPSVGLRHRIKTEKERETIHTSQGVYIKVIS